MIYLQFDCLILTIRIKEMFPLFYIIPFMNKENLCFVKGIFK